MLVNPNTPNFKGNIIFSRKAYSQLPIDELFAKNKCVDSPWLITDSKMLDEGFTDGASVCTMGFIKPKGGKEGYLFHCIPSSNPFDKIKEAIVPVIQKFQEGGQIVEGILVGANFSNKDSFWKAERFMELFDGFNIKYSAFLGQLPVENQSPRFMNENPRMDMFVSVPRDEYILSSFDGPELFNQGELVNRFHVIKRAAQDRFIFE